MDTQLGAATPPIRKLGTIDCDMVETTPVVYRGRLYRFEYVRRDYARNEMGESYFRFVDVATGETTPPFATGLHLGSAFCEADTVYAFGVDQWGGTKLHAYWSKDLPTWSSCIGLEQRTWGMYNTSVCRAGDRYVIAIELGEPRDEIGERFTMRFAESRDLLDWCVLPPDRVFSKDRYTACPAIRYLDDLFYMIYLESLPGPSWQPHIARSADLIEWESSLLNPVLSYGPEDKAIGNSGLSEEERHRIESALNRNNSDVDLCEHEGRTILYYSWGDQEGNEFLAHAVYNGQMSEFLRGFFPTDAPNGSAA